MKIIDLIISKLQNKVKIYFEVLKFGVHLFQQNEIITKNTRKMKTTINVNTENFSDTNELKFKQTIGVAGMVDIIYKNQRIAIVNGVSAPLQWTAKNGSNVPNKIIDKIERLVKRNLIK